MHGDGITIWGCNASNSDIFFFFFFAPRPVDLAQPTLSSAYVCEGIGDQGQCFQAHRRPGCLSCTLDLSFI